MWILWQGKNCLQFRFFREYENLKHPSSNKFVVYVDIKLFKNQINVPKNFMYITKIEGNVSEIVYIFPEIYLFKVFIIRYYWYFVYLYTLHYLTFHSHFITNFCRAIKYIKGKKYASKTSLDNLLWLW